MNFDVIAGICLMIAYGFFGYGKVYIANFFFIITNFFFLLESIQNHHFFAIITIGFAIIVSIFVIFKMKNGKFIKNLKQEV